MIYRIRATHTYYAPTKDVTYILGDGFGSDLEFDSEAKALAEIERLDQTIYHRSHNEYGRPDYAVVTAAETFSGG